MNKIVFVLFLMTILIDTWSHADPPRVNQEFSFFDDKDEEDEGAMSMNMDSDEFWELGEKEEEELLRILSKSEPMQSWLSNRAFEGTLDTDTEMLQESLDSDDQDELIKLLKLGYRFNDKLAKRAKDLDEISAEFDKFVLNGFAVSNHFFHLLNLHGELLLHQEFLGTVLNMMAQAETNIESIHKVTGMYRERIVQNEEGLGKLETLPAQYNAIASFYKPEMDEVDRIHPIVDILEQLKGDVSMTVKKEKNIILLFRVFMEEQKNLIALGQKLWVNSQENYDRKIGEEEEEGGLKRNPTNEDILKQVLEVRRTRRAISAYSDFLKREGIQNKTVDKTKKDEL